MTAKSEFHNQDVLAWGRRLRPAVIAIDGPAASGKSTLGFRLAQLLDYLFLHSYVPRKYAVVQAWLIAATAGGSVLMFTAVAIRQLARK